MGTCYALVDPAAPADLNLDVVPCSHPHTYELAVHEVASGDDSTFPADSYWNGVVAQTCYRDLLAYTGLARAAWPSTLSSDEFIPQRSGWLSGDRAIFCLARSTPPTSGSVRKKAA